jgi:flagellar basal-body rod protein FlgF
LSRAIYTSMSGAQAAWRQLEVLANNMANGGTQGFRESRVSFAAAGADMATVGSTRFSAGDGQMQTDDVPTHVALRGDGFFALADGSFTRDGEFRLDDEGQLVSREGIAVLGDGGPIQVQPGELLQIGEDGSVRGSTSGEVGRLSVVSLAGARPLGGARWSGNASNLERPTVVQGALEGSNVDLMRGMVEMIEASRFFEAQQKAMQTADDMHQRINRIGGS